MSFWDCIENAISVLLDLINNDMNTMSTAFSCEDYIPPYILQMTVTGITGVASIINNSVPIPKVRSMNTHYDVWWSYVTRRNYCYAGGYRSVSYAVFWNGFEDSWVAHVSLMGISYCRFTYTGPTDPCDPTGE